MARGTGRQRQAGGSPAVRGSDQDRLRPIDFEGIDFGYAGVDHDIFRQWKNADDYQYIDEVQLGKIDVSDMAQTIVTYQQNRSSNFDQDYRDLNSADVKVLTAILSSLDLRDDHFHASIIPGYYGDELDGIYLESHCQTIDALWNDYLRATRDDEDGTRRQWLRDHQLKI